MLPFLCFIFIIFFGGGVGQDAFCQVLSPNVNAQLGAIELLRSLANFPDGHEILIVLQSSRIFSRLMLSYSFPVIRASVECLSIFLAERIRAPLCRLSRALFAGKRGLKQLVDFLGCSELSSGLESVRFSPYQQFLMQHQVAKLLTLFVCGTNSDPLTIFDLSLDSTDELSPRNSELSDLDINLSYLVQERRFRINDLRDMGTVHHIRSILCSLSDESLVLSAAREFFSLHRYGSQTDFPQEKHKEFKLSPFLFSPSFSSTPHFTKFSMAKKVYENSIFLGSLC